MLRPSSYKENEQKITREMRDLQKPFIAPIGDITEKERIEWNAYAKRYNNLATIQGISKGFHKITI